MAKSPTPADFEIADGTVISFSGKKTIMGVIAACLLLLVGFFCLFFSGSTCLTGTGVTANVHNTHPAVLFSAAGVLLLLAVFCFVAGAIVGYRCLSGYFNKERYVLGADALQ